jgi:hypothetical protein
MTDRVLTTGWAAPLTEFAADCALDLIALMKAAAIGDETKITPAMRAAWRTHRMMYYPMLAPEDQLWFANAPATLAAIKQGWAYLPAAEQDLCRHAWASMLPALLQFASPVWAAPVAPATPAAPPSTSQAAIDELNRRRAVDQTGFSAELTGFQGTLDLMRTWQR